ncbi:hypothetical protein L1987_33403 [Smallanthus sonchifolius]|uniref:Uncharacterized protein n=1 Tax=Smallanthus sonchifolius TaxID=185202 RepID=A0ACB9HQQ9_9ASTR|nr:hypothetical protein L1987_33403 [Smallanthus sonchifolius]
MEPFASSGSPLQDLEGDALYALRRAMKDHSNVLSHLTKTLGNSFCNCSGSGSGEASIAADRHNTEPI